MANLSACRACGHQVSTEARACPQCVVPPGIATLGTSMRMMVVLVVSLMVSAAGLIEARADSPAQVAADCVHATANILAIAKEATARADAAMRAKVRQTIVGQCAEEKWGESALKCFVYAKERDDLENCIGRLTQEQKDRLTSAMEEATQDGRVALTPGSGGGWQALVTSSPWETDAVNLCGPIDPPMASRSSHWSPGLNSPSLDNDCHHWIVVQAADLQHCLSGLQIERCGPARPEIDAKVSGCLLAMQAMPYLFTGFNSVTACDPFDEYINSDSRDLQSANHRKVEAKLRIKVARYQHYKSECLEKTRAAVAVSKAARSAGARSAALGTLRDIPPSERVPEEAARIASEIAACRAEATRRREERVKIAATRDIRELRAIDPSFLLPEERTRIAAADAERAAADAERVAVLEKRRADPKWMGPVLSAFICVGMEKKNIAAKEIRTEQAYAQKYGGIIDKAKIYNLQQQIHKMDIAISEVRTLLRRLKASPRGCQDDSVRQVVICLSQHDDPGCATKQIREYLELAAATSE
jgi:hypothetical protein